MSKSFNKKVDGGIFSPCHSPPSIFDVFLHALLAVSLHEELKNTTTEHRRNNSGNKTKKSQNRKKKGLVSMGGHAAPPPLFFFFSAPWPLARAEAEAEAELYLELLRAAGPCASVVVLCRTEIRWRCQARIRTHHC
jgi:hypothetical protein